MSEKEKRPYKLSKLFNVFKRNKRETKVYVNKHNFQKLTPIKDADLEIYSNALDFAFASDELKNIALSGAYSAGKSSIIETYKDKNQDKKFIHISLAQFKDIDNPANVIKDLTESIESNSPEDDEPENAEKLRANVTSLEGKILNQLIHQINHENIPQSNFRTKRQYRTRKAVVPSLLATAFILSILYMIFFDSWYTYVYELAEGRFRNVFLVSTHDVFRLTIGVFCVAFFTMLLCKLIKLQLNRRIFNFKRFGAGNVDIEIFEDSKDSYFDKYLNEVLYLFDRSDADAIVLEDLDRYNAILVFQRLREINSLVNAKRIERDGESYKPLRFLYLLRDDIFDSKDRTKFFDYIVPIIPVIDGSNAYDQFIKHLKLGGVFEKFTTSFLKDLSLYIDDMRLLKNIYNEFMVYHGKLNSIGLSPDKMLAMIAYKNLFPHDFSNLPLRRGFVYALFSNKESFISAKKKALQSKLRNAEIALENAKNELLLKLNEWDIIYNYRREEIEERYGYISYSHHPNYQKRADEYTALDSESDKRKVAIENRINNRMPHLEADITQLKINIAKASNEQLKDIISNDNRDVIFDVKVKNDIGYMEDFSSVRGSDYFNLLKYFIRRGYIDENYNDYITYFYPESLSHTDKVFLLSIANQSKLEYSYSLKEPEKVTEDMNILSFDEPAVLNFDLMFYLLKNRVKHKNFLNGFFAQLRRNKNFDYAQAAVVFMNDWKIDDDRIIDFTNQMNSSWTGFLQDILKGADFSEICRDRFILSTLYHTPDGSLAAVNTENCLDRFISGKSDFLNISEPNTTRLLSRFNLLGVSFELIDYDKSDSTLFNGVYEQSLYELTFKNISQMLVRMYGLDETSDFYHKNYTLICSQPKSPLAGYINANFEEYIETVLSNCDGKITDDEARALEIINSGIDSNYKERYIAKLIAPIEKLIEVDDTPLWKLLVGKRIVFHTEKNVLDYYVNCENQLSKELITFINESKEIFNFAPIRNDYDDEISGAFFRSVVICNLIDNKQYRSILVSLNRVYSSGFGTDGIDEDKIFILIEASIIRMHVSTLIFFREHYPNVVLSYIKKSIVKYLEIIGDVIDDEPLFNFNEMLSVLSTDVAEEHMLKLIEHTIDEISIKNMGYADVLAARIIHNNFMESDLEWLLNNYSKQGTETKIAVEDLVIKRINSIFDMETEIPSDLFISLMHGTKADQIDKPKLFVLVLPAFDDVRCKQYIPVVNLEGDYMSIFDGKRPLIPKSEINERILNIFKEKGWITKFDPDEKSENHYRAIGRKTRANDLPEFLD